MPKRVPVQLSDGEIDILVIALDSYSGDLAASGAEWSDEHPSVSVDDLHQRLLVARGKVRKLMKQAT